MGLLSEDEIASRTRMIGPWDYDPEDKMLVRETTFKDFKEAVEFIKYGVDSNRFEIREKKFKP